MHEHEGRWLVDARRGGSGGSSRWAEAASEPAAVDLTRSIQNDPARWQDMAKVLEKGR